MCIRDSFMSVNDVALAGSPFQVQVTPGPADQYMTTARGFGISGGYSGIAAKVAVTTTLAAAGGAIVAGSMSYLIDGLQDLSAMANGILAGLVSITAPCSATEPWAALVIGMIGGVVYVLAVRLLEKVGVDDVVLAIPVHCFW